MFHLSNLESLSEANTLLVISQTQVRNSYCIFLPLSLYYSKDFFYS